MPKGVYKRKIKPLVDRYWAKVVKHELGCWEFTGAKNAPGYGVLGAENKRRNILAHRASWEIHFGPVPEGMHVLHTCDNPPCTRPDHLFLGSNQDNITDKVSKNRQSRLKGEMSGRAKLEAEQILEIREVFEHGNHTYTSLGRMYGVHAKTISDIINRENWKHL